MKEKILKIVNDYTGKYSEQNPKLAQQHLYDYEMSKLILKIPQLPPRDFLNRMREIFKHEIPFNIISLFKINNLGNPDIRIKWSSDVKKAAELFLQILGGNNDISLNTAEKIKEIIYYDKMLPKMTCKTWLVACEEMINDENLKKALNIFNKKSGYMQAKMLALNLCNFLSLGRNNNCAKKSIKDKISTSSELIKEALGLKLNNECDGQNNVNINFEEKLIFLENQNEDFKSALEIVQQQLDSLKDEIETIKLEAQNEATINFFQYLNSHKNGALLDQMALAEKKINDLKNKKYDIPVELESVTTTVKMFMRYIRNLMITPIEEVGVKKEINLEASEMYEYSGSDFNEKSQMKKVAVMTPGWRCNETIISRPKVSEIIE